MKPVHAISGFRVNKKIAFFIMTLYDLFESS